MEDVTCRMGFGAMGKKVCSAFTAICPGPIMVMAGVGGYIDGRRIRTMCEGKFA